MEQYNLLIELNRKLLSGEDIFAREKENYIPPLNGGKKLRLVQGYLPKTNILYANHYELEILRFLAVACPEDAEWIEKLLHPLEQVFLSSGKGKAAVRRDVPMSYLQMAFADIYKEKSTEWILK